MLACAYCMNDTCYEQLEYNLKQVYIRHQSLLGMTPAFRHDRRFFDSTIEMWDAQKMLTGFGIYYYVCDITNVFATLILEGEEWIWTA